eukprot:TRINITY_DN118765_c0_g1_i1.p1 TRINITY_DN118765_c0_g1~~TRINITY_DN118765_c0_g1_i1.p1  ORF type:complete len:267 (-),score=66.13 TRINITY_DN118765_c0_g1_i1:101-901(-)
MAGSHEDLVIQIKDLCRADQNAKAQWCSWCSSNAEGTKDPNRLTAEMLNSFLIAFNAGEISAGPQYSGGKGGKGGWGGGASWGGGFGGGGGGGYGMGMPEMGMPDIISLGQRYSPAWKTAWCTYCSTYGDGMYDPKRHSNEFVQNFLELMATGGMEIMNTDPAAAQNMKIGIEQGFGNPAKRPRSDYEGYGMGKGMSSGKGGGGPSHAPGSEGDRIAQNIKQMQKTDPVKKQMWSDFCDQNGDGWGTKDPSRLPLATLQAFLEIAS